MKTKSPGEIVIYHEELHRKHLVDSYKYPGETKNNSPGEILIYHGGKYPGELSVSPPGEVFRFTTVNPPVVKRRKPWGKCPFPQGGIWEFFPVCISRNLFSWNKWHVKEQLSVFEAAMLPWC